MHILKIELFSLLHHIFFNNFLLSLNIFIISSIYSFLVTDFHHSYGNGKLICFAIKFIKIDLGASKMLDFVIVVFPDKSIPSIRIFPFSFLNIISTPILIIIFYKTCFNVYFKFSAFNSLSSSNINFPSFITSISSK